MAAPVTEQKDGENKGIPSGSIGKSENEQIAKYIPIKVKEVHDLALEFEKCHKKDTASLQTLHAAQSYLTKYWSFYEQNGRNADAMNQTIKKSVTENRHSTAYILHQLAVNSREVIIKNKINLPFGNGTRPTEVELRALLPKNSSKVVAPNTPPQPSGSGGNNQILAMFQAANSLRTENDNATE